MKKISVIVFLLSGVFLLITSCNKQKTYADHLKDETKAIEKFIAKNKFTILKDFPKDTVFKANEFYRDPATGVYVNIVDRGQYKEKVKPGEEVYVRFKNLLYFMKNDTIKFDNLNPHTSPNPQTLIYRGPVNMINRSLYSTTVAGWVVPLPYVGNTATVRLIIPFNMGSSSDMNSFQPAYFETVQYRFEFH